MRERKETPQVSPTLASKDASEVPNLNDSSSELPQSSKGNKPNNAEQLEEQERRDIGRIVLGSALVDPTSARLVSLWLKVDDFTTHASRLLFLAIKKTLANRQPVDLFIFQRVPELLEVLRPIDIAKLSDYAMPAHVTGYIKALQSMRGVQL